MMALQEMVRFLKQGVRNSFWRAGYELRKHPGVAYAPLDVFGLCVEHLMRIRSCSIYFIQAGANDGVQGDPLRRYILRHPWSGILVEPQPQVFARLKKNYAAVSRQLFFENAAIAANASEVDLWAPDFDKLEDDSAHAIASLDRKTAQRQMGNLKAPLRRIRVPCRTMDHLVEKHHLPRLDLVQVDTEGYDWKALETLDIGRHKPALIQFEVGHLDRKDRRTAFGTLDALGYDLMWLGADAIALRREVYKTLPS